MDARTRALFEVNIDDIMANAIPDVPLQAGDSVSVPQRVY